MSKKKIVIIGGGTGTYVALTGLKEYPIQLSAIITMMDSGGSSGKLRDQLGVLPPGDLRQALVALSQSERAWRNLFLYRFEEGDLKGHNFGNLFISALEKNTGSLQKAIQLANQLLQVKGTVIPVTFDSVDLCVELSNGTRVIGETHIDEPDIRKKRKEIVNAYLNPKAQANPKAIQAIKSADMIVLGPGDLYTSIIPNLLVEDISKAIASSKAKLVYVVNLMTKFGQTNSYSAQKHVKVIEKYGKRSIDIVLMNTKKPPKYALSWYNVYQEKLVKDDVSDSKYKVIRDDFLSTAQISKNEVDRLRRSIIRHDSKKLASALVSLI